MGSCELLSRLISNLNSPDLSFPSIWDYKREPPAPGPFNSLKILAEPEVSFKRQSTCFVNVKP
jgi:hypothetical protein